MGKLADDFIRCEECSEWIKNNTRSKLKHLNTVHRVKNDHETTKEQKPVKGTPTLKSTIGSNVMLTTMTKPTPTPEDRIEQIRNRAQ